MKVPRAYLGKLVEVQWMDPQFTRITLSQADRTRKGRGALATWREYGVIGDMSDGIIRIVHSAARSAGSPEDRTDEIAYTPVPEALIESIRVFEPVEPPATPAAP